MAFWTALTFLAFTGGVALITYLVTRKSNVSTENGFFLAGRSLTFPFIAGSLLLTNLSTEQMVGLNGSAFSCGFSVFVWEVIAVIALVLMALFFLPRFLKSGIATVPQFLEIRYASSTRMITNIIFLSFYMIILMPILLYTGAQAMIDIFGLKKVAVSIPIDFIANAFASNIGDWLLLQTIIVVIAIIGGIYALWGGLKTVTVSDTLNGIGLLVGGFLIVYFAYKVFGGGSFIEGVKTLPKAVPGRFNSLGAADSEVPAATILTGVLLINVFYWCTNQQIIQRTLAASSLAEGQKGVLLCGLLKLVGPLYLVIPGIVAYAMYKNGMLDIPVKSNGELNSAAAYGTLVNAVLPDAWRGFFAATLLGAILSSFNSCLNSICTMYSLGIYKHFKKSATELQVVKSGQIFGLIFVIITVIIAPLLSNTSSIFNYLQNMNAIYFIPILAVVLVGMLSKRIPAAAANTALIGGVIILGIAQMIPNFTAEIVKMNNYHFSALVFLFLVIVMIVIGKINPRTTDFVQEDAHAIDMTPWNGAKYIGAILVLIVLSIYVIFADTGVLRSSSDTPNIATAAEQVVPETVEPF